VDNNGNIYLTGFISSKVSFGGSLLGKTNDLDVFVASFTPGGKHRWSKSFGGTNNDIGYDVAVDNSGNVYITGTFFNSISFGGPVFQSKGVIDIFIASFDTNGKHRWSKSFGGSVSGNNPCEPSLAADGAGNTYLTGYFDGSTSFGGSTLNSKSSTSDVFLASFDTGGKHRWSKTFGDIAPERGQGVAVDGSGNSYITGHFRGTINFGGSSLTSNGNYDVFLASFASGGAHRWSKGLGGTSDDQGNAVAVDGNANVFITGKFYNSADFGGGKLTSNGYTDIFVASFTSNGAHRWSKAFGSSNNDDGSSITADNTGNAYVTGYYFNKINFGGGSLSSKGSYDMFVVSFSPTGTHRWSRSNGSTSWDQGTGIVTDGTGNIYVAGSFFNTVDFGGGPITSAGKSDMVLLKLSP